MKKIFLFLAIVSCLVGFKQAGVRHITGHVYAKDDGLPIPGVSVKVKGTAIGVQTSTNGFYAIDVPDGYDKLVYSYVGFVTKEARLTDKDSIDVTLEANPNQLAEVVVTTPGVQAQPNSVGYSTATIASPQVARGSNSIAYNTPILSIPGATTPKRDKSTRSAQPNYVPPPATGTESYERINENGFTSVRNEPLSTFSVDVDNASYTNVRRFINNGELPPADAVRIEEMINYFKYNLKAPVDGRPVGVQTELSSAPWNPRHRLMRVALKAKELDAAKLPPSNLVFLIDVSGSMGQPNKLPLVKASMKMLTEQLRPEDRVAIVTYAGMAGVALESTPGDKKERIMDAINALNAGGSTNGGEGIKMAYRIAKENFIEKGNNRIILATDGDFNVGPNSDEDMETLIVHERESRVAISIMGFGMGNLKDSKMGTMADKGNGNYAYIDNITEARKAFVSEFAGTLYTVAKDVKIQIEFNPAKVQAYRLLGYEDRMLNKEDFNNDRKDAGEMGSGHAVTALYEIIPTGIKDDYAGSVDPLKYQKPEPAPAGKGSDELLTIKVRYKPSDNSPSKLEQLAVKDTPVTFNAVSADFRFAAAVAEFGMLLRDSQYKGESSFDQVTNIASNAKGPDAEGYRSEFVRLAQSAKLLAKTSLAAY